MKDASECQGGGNEIRVGRNKPINKFPARNYGDMSALARCDGNG